MLSLGLLSHKVAARAPRATCILCHVPLEELLEEQGDFVPISKDLTTQLGRTDGNNYNKAGKRNLIQ